MIVKSVKEKLDLCSGPTIIITISRHKKNKPNILNNHYDTVQQYFVSFFQFYVLYFYKKGHNAKLQYTNMYI